MERLKSVFPPLNSTTAWGLSTANSWLHSPRIAKYAPLMNVQFPNYYYSRTSNPFRYSGNGLGELYTSSFAASIQKEHTIEPLRRLFAKVKGQGVLDQMLYIDTKTWLPDDLLIKADKMTMANSVELRVPLLDHKVLEFAASLPSHYKVKGLTTKRILKDTLSKRVPQRILERKKVGFPVPYGSWLRNECKDVTWSVLTDRKTAQRGYFENNAIKRLIERNNNDGIYSKEVFSLVTLELWQRAFLDRGAVMSH